MPIVDVQSAKDKFNIQTGLQDECLLEAARDNDIFGLDDILKSHTVSLDAVCHAAKDIKTSEEIREYLEAEIEEFIPPSIEAPSAL